MIRSFLALRKVIRQPRLRQLASLAARDVPSRPVPAVLPAPFLTGSSFAKDFGLPSSLSRVLFDIGIRNATGIQEKALKAVLKGTSAIVAAETGTGKTLLYLLPIAARIARGEVKDRGKDFVVLLPNQELVLQVAALAKMLIETTTVKHGDDNRAQVVPLSGGTGAPTIASASAGEDSARRSRVWVTTPQAFVNHHKRNSSGGSSASSSSASSAGGRGPAAAAAAGVGAAVVAFDEADLLLSATFRNAVEECLLLCGAAEKLETGQGKEAMKNLRLKREAVQFIACAATLLEPFSVSGKDKSANQQNSFGAWLHRHLIANDRSSGSLSTAAAVPPTEVFRSPGLHRPASLVKVRFSYVVKAKAAEALQPQDEAPEKLEARRMTALLAALRTSIPAPFPSSSEEEEAAGEATTSESESGVVSFSLAQSPLSSASKKRSAATKRKRLHQALVFVNDFTAAERVAAALRELAPDLKVAALHKNVPPSQRASIISSWLDQVDDEDGGEDGQGGLDVVVATDLAARGLDTTSVGQVVLFDLPLDLPAYLHRIGRTARAGAKGLVTLIVVDPDQRDFARRLHELAEEGMVDSLAQRWNAAEKQRRIRATSSSSSSSSPSRTSSFPQRTASSPPRRYSPSRADSFSRGSASSNAAKAVNLI